MPWKFPHNEKYFLESLLLYFEKRFLLGCSKDSIEYDFAWHQLYESIFR